MTEEQPLIITFPIEPVPYMRVGYNRSGIAYVPSKEKQFRAKLAQLAKFYYRKLPLTGALRVHMDFYFIKATSSKLGAYVVKRPDISNLLKSCEDALNGILWHDDCLIVELHGRKLFGPEFKIDLKVEVLR